MKVHHLDCGTMCPFGGGLVVGPGPGRPRLVCHCLLVETSAGLVLVDTGIGTEDCARPYARLGAFFTHVVRPTLDVGKTAVSHVERLGYAASDVRHVVLTHLDLDHAGGLSDFPDAFVHVLADEHRAMTSPPTLHERLRYRRAQFSHGPRFVLHASSGEPWFGFSCVRDLPGLPPEILMVPLSGHTRGHAAVAVHARGQWILHAGDAYFHRDELDFESPRCPPALGAFQTVMAVDDSARLDNQRRLRVLAHGHPEVTVFCAHDRGELSRFSNEIAVVTAA